MQSASMMLCLLLLATPLALADTTNPLSKTIELIRNLESKVKADQEEEAKAFKEYFEWCDEAARNLKFDIKTATSQTEKLEAEIGELTSDIQVCDTKIEDLASSIATASQELKGATAQREKEALDFAAAEAELLDAIDTLGRAVSVLEREMQKNPAAFAQLNAQASKHDFANVVSSLGAVIDAAGFSASDKKQLVALVQSKQSSDEDDSDLDLNAPAAAVYESKSTGIVDVLQDMKDKSEEQLSALRKSEGNAQHNFAMLKQSLEDQIADDNKGLEEEKSRKAKAQEDKATAEGELATAQKNLATAKASLEMATNNCMQVATDHEATAAAFTEELKVMAQVIEILESSTSGAVSQSYSLLQLTSSSLSGNRAQLAGSKVVTLVKKLAKKHHSTALAQLASQIAAVVRYGAANGEAPFAKVKGLIQQLIEKLEAEGKEEATEKAYCDEQMSKTNAKKDELNDDIAKLTAKIDQSAARSATLKEQVKELQGELAALMKLQAEMDKIREDSHAAYVEAKADVEQGLAGVRQALNILRDYFAADESADAALVQQPEPPRPETFKKQTGAGTSIIGVLEVVESDFAKNLATEETEEADAAAEYEKQTQENKVLKATKEQDVKYKTQEAANLDKAIAELSGDREAANTELSAVLEYLEKLTDRCVAKPETYEERKAKRTAEIEGLKQALNILENETAFVQRRNRRSMRGAMAM